MRTVRFVGAGSGLLGLALALGGAVLLSGCDSGSSGGTGPAAMPPQAQEQRKSMEQFYNTKAAQKAGPRR